MERAEKAKEGETAEEAAARRKRNFIRGFIHGHRRYHARMRSKGGVLKPRRLGRRRAGILGGPNA